MDVLPTGKIIMEHKFRFLSKKRQVNQIFLDFLKLSSNRPSFQFIGDILARTFEGSTWPLSSLLFSVL